MGLKKISVLVLLFLMTACGSSKLWSGPAPHTLPQDVPGPPEYQEGYKDGCQSGLATYGDMIYKMYYSYYQNYGMLKNPAYVAGWHESFNYCRHFNLKYSLEGDNLLSTNIFAKFVPKMLKMAKGYDALLGKKRLIYERIHGWDVDQGMNPDYRSGWDDGCETGTTAYGNLNTKAIQKARGKSFVRDTTKIGNQQYESGWWEGYNFCRNHHNTFEKNYDDDWGPLFELK